jgi:hypothetical protein
MTACGAVIRLSTYVCGVYFRSDSHEICPFRHHIKNNKLEYVLSILVELLTITVSIHNNVPSTKMNRIGGVMVSMLASVV